MLNTYDAILRDNHLEKKKIKSEMNDELRPEYELRRLLKNGVRGKHYKAMRHGYTIKIHKSDGTTVVKYVR